MSSSFRLTGHQQKWEPGRLRASAVSSVPCSRCGCTGAGCVTLTLSLPFFSSCSFYSATRPQGSTDRAPIVSPEILLHCMIKKFAHHCSRGSTNNPSVRTVISKLVCSLEICLNSLFQDFFFPTNTMQKQWVSYPPAQLWTRMHIWYLSLCWEM